MRAKHAQQETGQNVPSITHNKFVLCFCPNTFLDCYCYTKRRYFAVPHDDDVCLMLPFFFFFFSFPVWDIYIYLYLRNRIF